ncbi:hypothetical protein F4809DRAFT_472083 [Biscogniauxia mediterranea]|nr:hypothetical protein F4809DRAFT_472083 [Biscogniauxia mediterranea]
MRASPVFLVFRFVSFLFFSCPIPSCYVTTTPTLHYINSSKTPTYLPVCPWGLSHSSLCFPLFIFFFFRGLWNSLAFTGKGVRRWRWRWRQGEIGNLGIGNGDGIRIGWDGVREMGRRAFLHLPPFCRGFFSLLLLSYIYDAEYDYHHHHHHHNTTIYYRISSVLRRKKISKKHHILFTR